jgi:hypothetical protein
MRSERDELRCVLSFDTSVARSSHCAPEISRSSIQVLGGIKPAMARAIADEWLLACGNRMRIDSA